MSCPPLISLYACQPLILTSGNKNYDNLSEIIKARRAAQSGAKPAPAAPPSPPSTTTASKTSSK
jgi:hypothetical protein